MGKTVVIVSIASMFFWCGTGTPSSVLAQENEPRGEATIGKCLADLRDRDPFVRRQAVWELERRDREWDLTKAVPALIEALNDSESEQVRDARRVLSRIGFPAFKTLQLALKDKRVSVKRGVIELIGDIGFKCKPALPELSDFLKSEDLSVRAAAARSVFRLSGSAERSVPILREALTDGSTEFAPVP